MRLCRASDNRGLLDPLLGSWPIPLLQTLHLVPLVYQARERRYPGFGREALPVDQSFRTSRKSSMNGTPVDTQSPHGPRCRVVVRTV